MTEKPYGLGERFLQQMDDYIKENYPTMTCKNMYDIYEGVFDTLKTFRSNSFGFTGLYEFFIFRFVFYALGGKFNTISIYENRPEDKDIKKFVSMIDSRLVISQGVRMNIKGTPDILIQYDEKPFSLIEIKTYPPNGEETINKEFKKFNYYREEYPKLNVLLLIFRDVSTKEKQVLDKLEKKRQGNNFLILNNEKNKNEPLLPLLNNYLKLPELTKKILPIQR